MLTLRLAFPWGRYYAHPWGENPARITEAEWPPSPWRLLRAIAAAWFQANPGQVPGHDLIETLEVLGCELPSFILPKVAFSRAIHYQPNYGATPKDDLALAKYKRVRHESHFVAVGGDVLIRWQLNGVSGDTASRVRSLMNDLSGRISYFGRAESVCEFQIDEAEHDEAGVARVALQDEKPCRQIHSICRDVFCPDPSDFRASDLWRRRADDATDGQARKHLVQELIDAPQPMPDGAAWYSYRMPEGWPDRWIVRHARPPRRAAKPSRVVAQYLEFSLQCRIPIPVKHIVSIAEMFRAAAMRIHGDASFALSGRDRPDDVDGHHLHAFYLPRPDTTGPYLSTLQVRCIHGFTQREVNALMSVGPLPWAGGRFPARPVLLQLQRDIPQLEKSRVWRSTTPFVPPRYWYRKKLAEGRAKEADNPENQLRFCFRENGTDPAAVLVQRMDVANSYWDVCKVHLHEDVLMRQREPTHRVGLFLKVIFPEPILLPFPSYGHSAHFGLGQFQPFDE